MEDVEYAGFWVRTGAALIDTLLIAIIALPILTLIYGQGYWAGDSASRGVWDVMFMRDHSNDACLLSHPKLPTPNPELQPLDLLLCMT